MAAKKAVRYVTAGGTTYAPGEEIPADVAATIDNPKAWVDPDADGDNAEADEAPAKPAKKTAAKRS